MGTASRRKARFKKLHPYCCFCGGNTATEEEDHIPARVIFDGRRWPEGYSFPACVQCNRITRNDEQIIGFLSRINPDAETEEQLKESIKRIEALANYFPDVLAELKPTIRQNREFRKVYGIDLPPGKTHADLPTLNIGGPLVTKALVQFGRKLAMALFFKHTSKILPNDSGIAVLWLSNVQIAYSELPEQLAWLLDQFPTLERSNINLDDQFFYRYTISEEQDVGVFLCFFRKSFVILGYVAENRNKLKLPQGTAIFGPFEHTQA